jgi:hypothetical protein
MTYDVSLENTKAVGYASPNDKVLKEMSAPDGLFGQNKAYLPRSGYDKDEIFHDNEVIRSMISELWIKVKAHKAN